MKEDDSFLSVMGHLPKSHDELFEIAVDLRKRSDIVFTILQQDPYRVPVPAFHLDCSR